MRLAECHIRLHAAMLGIKLEVLIVSQTSAVRLGLHDGLVGLTMAMMDLRRRSEPQAWRMQIVLRESPGPDESLLIEVDSRCTIRLPPARLQDAQARIQTTLMNNDPPIRVLSLLWNSSRPRRLSMTCVMP